MNPDAAVVTMIGNTAMLSFVFDPLVEAGKVLTEDGFRWLAEDGVTFIVTEA